MTGPAPAASARDTLPLEVRAVIVLLAFEVVAGVWFALNWPPGMSLFLSQIPAIGAAGVVWGFLPDAPKKEFGEWLANRLRRPVVWISIVIVLTTALVASLFVNTVEVSGAPENPTWVHLQRGDALRPLSGDLAASDSIRLRRGAEKGYFWLFTLPMGRRVWLRSASHLTPDELRVVPWRPSKVSYPDDFELPAVVATLPGAEAVEEITSPHPWRVIVLDATTSDTLGIDTLASPGARLFAFIQTPTPADSVARWGTVAAGMRGGMDSVLFRMWSDSARTRFTRRPLRANERVRIIAVDSTGKTVSTKELRLTNGLSTTLVAP